MKRPAWFTKQSELRTHWIGVVMGSALIGQPGITHKTNDEQPGTHVLEFRDEEGRLRGVLTRYGETERCPGEVFLMTDPQYRRRGIATQLLADAQRLNLPLDFEKQPYTRAGWATVRKFLQRNGKR